MRFSSTKNLSLRAPTATLDHRRSFASKSARCAKLVLGCSIISAALIITGNVSTAFGVTLDPGGSSAISGTSAAADPSLNGTVEAQSTSPIAAYSAADSTQPGFYTQLQSTVIRESSGTLDFYYQILNNNRFFVDPVKSVSIGGFAGANTDANFRADLGGGYAPLTASRDATGDTVTFSGFPYAIDFVFTPGTKTNALIIKTNATTYTDNGPMTIQFAGVDTSSEFPAVPASASLSTYAPGPSGIPEPSSFWLFGLTVVALGCGVRLRHWHIAAAPSPPNLRRPPAGCHAYGPISGP